MQKAFFFAHVQSTVAQLVKKQLLIALSPCRPVVHPQLVCVYEKAGHERVCEYMRRRVMRELRHCTSSGQAEREEGGYEQQASGETSSGQAERDEGGKRREGGGQSEGGRRASGGSE